MKKIAYIELDTHAEIAANFMELMEDSKEFLVDYYFSKKIIQRICDCSENVFEVAPQTLRVSLKKEKYNLVIIGTVHRYFNLFNSITSKLNTAVIVHNLNFTRITKAQLFRNIFKKDFAYRLKLLVKEGLFLAPKVFEKAGNLLVLDESLTKENADLKLKFLPVFHFKEYSGNVHSEVKIVIPGTVSQFRRDYLHILDHIENAKTDTHFQFIFLGKAVGKELSWIKNLINKKPDNISLTYFTNKVPPTIFDEWIRNADVLWCPIQKKTKFFSQTEIYGKTKMSGNIGDAIKFGKLAVFPKEYPKVHPFIIPEEEDVLSQLKMLKESSEYNFLQTFSKENVLKSLEMKLSELL